MRQRQERLRRFLLRAIVLFLVFVLSVGVTAYLQNTQDTENRQEMNDPYLPELMVDYGGVWTNRMSGYTRQLKTDFVRDCITVLDTTKELTFVINPYQAEVTSLAYEIRTCDGSKVMENRKIKVLQPGSEGTLCTTVTISSDLLLNQEYSMQITLETGRGAAYYYTRVVARSNITVGAYVAFVKDFVEKCLDDQNAADIIDYLEEGGTTLVTNYSNINIQSTFDQVTWGGLRPKMWIKGIPVIKDINETTCSVSMEYEIEAYDNLGNQEIYSVEEFYRMKLSSGNILLLDFNRSATQVFSPTSESISAEGLTLGVRNRVVTHRTNPETGTCAFVQDGELWSFSPQDGKATRIFSFRRDNGDFRDAKVMHGIQIIRVEDNSDVDFVLYGYMNRGEREGDCGVCVYHYSNDRNSVEEKVFIPSIQSPEFLQRDLSLLSYVSTDGRFYLLFGDRIYQVNTQEGSYEVLDQGVSPDSFASSDSGAHAAWIVQTGENAGAIKMIDFESGQTRFIRAKEKRQLRMIGFMNEDLVYGVLKESDILVDEVGHVWEGLRSLTIENFAGETLKKYKPEEDQYLTDFTPGNMLLEFWCSKKAGQTYQHVRKENIMNNSREANQFAKVELISSERAGTRVRLALADQPQTSSPLVMRAKMVSLNDRTITLTNTTVSNEEEQYYVYAYGSLEGIFSKVGDAVNRANEKLGVVLNRSQQYVWERGNKKTNAQIRLDEVPEAWKFGSVDVSVLSSSLEGEGTVLDFSGCSLESVLYEVSAQRPVVARVGTGEGILIAGYDEYNTWLYDKAKGTTYAYAMDDSVELFEKAGNVFFVGLESLGEVFY